MNDELVLEKSNKLGWVLAILTALLLGFGIYFYYLNFNNPQNVMKKSIISLSEKYSENKSDILTNKPIRINGNLSFDIDMNNKEYADFFNILNDVALIYTGDLDVNKKIITMDFDSKYKNNNLLSAFAYINNGKSYIKLNDIYDKYIKISDISNNNGLSNNTNTNNLTKEEINIMASSFYEILSNVLQEDDFKQEKDVIIYNNKQTEVNKNYIVYNVDNYKRINEKFINLLEKDVDLVNILKKHIGNNIIEEIKSTLSRMELTNESLELAIYTKGLTNSFVKASLQIVDIEDTILIEVMQDDVITLSFKSEEIFVKVVDNLNSNYNIDVSMSLENVGNISLKMTMNVSNIDNIKDIDITNVIDIKDMDNDEYNKIITNLSENKDFKKFINDCNEVRDNLTTNLY